MPIIINNVKIITHTLSSDSYCLHNSIFVRFNIIFSFSSSFPLKLEIGNNNSLIHLELRSDCKDGKLLV